MESKIDVSAKNVTFSGLMKIKSLGHGDVAYLCNTTQKQIKSWEKHNNPPVLARRVLQLYSLL